MESNSHAPKYFRYTLPPKPGKGPMHMYNHMAATAGGVQRVQGKLRTEGPLTYPATCGDGEEAEVLDFRFVSWKG